MDVAIGPNSVTGSPPVFTVPAALSSNALERRHDLSLDNYRYAAAYKLQLVV